MSIFQNHEIDLKKSIFVCLVFFFSLSLVFELYVLVFSATSRFQLLLSVKISGKLCMWWSWGCEKQAKSSHS